MANQYENTNQFLFLDYFDSSDSDDEYEESKRYECPFSMMASVHK